MTTSQQFPSLSWRLAWRELRRDITGGVRGFRIFLACLALGVAVIAGAGSLDAALRAALSEDARALLGGDAEIRLSYRSPSAEELVFFSDFGTISQSMEMRAMAKGEQTDFRQTLIELKAVDALYPLYGRLELDPPLSSSEAMAQKDGVWGVAVDANLLERLGLKVGDALRVGAARWMIRAVIRKEPDRVATAFSFGPRVLVDWHALAETGLVQPGSVIRYGSLIRFTPGVTFSAFKQALNHQFPDAGWFLRDPGAAAPGVKRFLDSMALFLTLVGLTALLVGGIGVANGVDTYLKSRIATIAILKCLGGSRRLILAVYGWQVAVLTVLGIIGGLAFGAAIPWGVVVLFGHALPVSARLGLYPQPLGFAAAFGGLTALAFCVGPLFRCGQVSALALFRQTIDPIKTWPHPVVLVMIGAAGLSLAGLAVGTAANHRLAAAFVGVVVLALLLFTLVGQAIMLWAGWLDRRLRKTGKQLSLRLALSTLSRPGSSTRGVALSLGLGLTVLVTVALVQANLNRQFDERMPAQAPTFFFIDIQPDQLAAFGQAIESAGGQEIARSAMVRGRISRINGAPVEAARIAPDAQWAVRGDRGLTSAAEPPPGTQVIAGRWWPKDYAGPPLVSMDAAIAHGFGLTLGDNVTLNILGREMTARIENLRDIDWSSLSMNFTFILTPNSLAGAPLTYIATVAAPTGRETMVERAVTEAVPTLSSIRVKEALEAVKGVVANAGAAIRAAAAVTLVAGTLVLLGAITAGRDRRARDFVLFKVLGARRADLLRAVLWEFAVLACVVGGVAALLGSVAAWAVLTFVLKADWHFLPFPVLFTVGGAGGAVILLGIFGCLRVLMARPAAYLRHE